MKLSRRLDVAVALLVMLPSAWSRPARAAEDGGTMPLVVTEDFEHGAGRWETTDPDPSHSVWQFVEVATATGLIGNHVFRVAGPSRYAPTYCSPLSIAWLKDVRVGDFELTVRVQNTSPNAGPHRDLCIFWGRQSPAEFYYVHLGAKPDPHACQIFIVNNRERTMITRDVAKGTPWTDGWHDVKVTRNAATGEMKVYFDDMAKPLMTAQDTTFGAGQIGIGTFDDSGNFDDVVLRGRETESGNQQQ